MKNRFAKATPLLLLLTLPGELASQAPPGTDIWAFRISGDRPEVNLASAVRVTERPGYDNQPHFPPGEHLILYTAIDSTGQADIWSYELTSGRRWNVTRSSPESEYSATVMPSRGRFSVIRVEADSTQRLWSFESGGTNPEVVLPALQPVGYHAWLDEDWLALFILGSPATLRIASVSTGQGEIVAENIGRSLHYVPAREVVSFVQLEGGGGGWISELDPQTGEVAPIAPVMEENEFHTLTPGGVILAGQGSILFRWVPGESEVWEEVADLGSAGIQGISRIAVSPGGQWIAVVGTEGGRSTPN